MFEAEVKRFLKKKAAGRYADKGRGIMGKFFSFIDTHRVFIPILFLFPFICLVSTIIIWGISVAGPAVLGLFSLAAGITSLSGLVPLLAGLIPVRLFTMRLNSIVHYLEV
ncbi:hypothetical protein PCYB_006300 [Plasmodium cynomolgi strain B]|uniref:Uncharacterized protein n=1 Tax=Plasmodium cynomolgi (strain B) TaxID=1120755 RepID=K6UFC9_PLACD|nr:hypothetical protein PCYB_006300 [Plasmodium cynomolgi strain B]GAB69881.1 hypothetical protein PCYB_006300 [Plasmodium cynomolgi strain B]